MHILSANILLTVTDKATIGVFTFYFGHSKGQGQDQGQGQGQGQDQDHAHFGCEYLVNDDRKSLESL